MDLQILVFGFILLMFTTVSMVMGYYIWQIMSAEEEKPKGCKKKKTRVYKIPDTKTLFDNKPKNMTQSEYSAYINNLQEETDILRNENSTEKENIETKKNVDEKEKTELKKKYD